MAHKNHMKVNGRAKNNSSAILEINLADDKREVRGFGQPITPASAVEMADNYFNQCKAAWEIIKIIDTNPLYIDLKNKPEFRELVSLVDPANQTVSGVFGKELILQILSQRGCEGIRYIQGKDKDKNTIILVAVEETGSFARGSDGTEHATSQPINFSPENEKSDMPVIGEVHEDAKTIEGVEELLRARGQMKSTEVTFGIF